MSQQCVLAAKALLQALGRGFIASRSGEGILPLYSALVRPHLQFWTPQSKRAIGIPEQAQECALKMMKGLEKNLKKISYGIKMREVEKLGIDKAWGYY